MIIVQIAAIEGKRKWEKMKLASQHFYERHDIGKGKDSAVFTAIVITAIESWQREDDTGAVVLFSFQSNTPQCDDASQYDDTLCKSLLPRYEDGVLVIPKALVKSPISAYENTLEVFSKKECQ